LGIGVILILGKEGRVMLKGESGRVSIIRTKKRTLSAILFWVWTTAKKADFRGRNVAARGTGNFILTQRRERKDPQR